MSTDDGVRHPWQMPEGGLGEEERAAFFSKIRATDEDGSRSAETHWLWEGPTNGNYPAFMLRGAMVAAHRIAWAIKRGGIIPGKLQRTGCEERKCVNPWHFARMGAEPRPLRKPPALAAPYGGTGPLPGVVEWDPAGTIECAEWDPTTGIATPVTRLTEEASPGTYEGETLEEMMGSFRTLDAMAALQFGKTPTKHVVRRLKVSEMIETVDGPQPAPLPIGTTHYLPSPVAKARFQSLSKQEMMDVLFAPNTLVVTYPSGSVLISGPKGRILAPDGETAVHGMLLISGQRRIVE